MSSKQRKARKIARELIAAVEQADPPPEGYIDCVAAATQLQTSLRYLRHLLRTHAIKGIRKKVESRDPKIPFVYVEIASLKNFEKDPKHQKFFEDQLREEATRKNRFYEGERERQKQKSENRLRLVEKNKKHLLEAKVSSLEDQPPDLTPSQLSAVKGMLSRGISKDKIAALYGLHPKQIERA